jgi:hypothetical protein
MFKKLLENFPLQEISIKIFKVSSNPYLPTKIGIGKVEQRIPVFV